MGFKEIALFQEDEQLLLEASFANFKFGSTLFPKIMPNFCRQHDNIIHKMQPFP